jgi:hypothetical protein
MQDEAKDDVEMASVDAKVLAEVKPAAKKAPRKDGPSSGGDSPAGPSSGRQGLQKSPSGSTSPIRRKPSAANRSKSPANSAAL